MYVVFPEDRHIRVVVMFLEGWWLWEVKGDPFGRESGRLPVAQSDQQIRKRTTSPIVVRHKSGG